MLKILEITKSFVALTAIIAIGIISIFGVTSLNPVSQLNLDESSLSNVAGLQKNSLEMDNIQVISATKDLKLEDRGIVLNIVSGATQIDAGEFTIENNSTSKGSIKIFVDLPAELRNQIRIELTDETNKILLKDFIKDYDSQKITLEANSSRSFKLRYILKSPLNYQTSITLALKI